MKKIYYLFSVAAFSTALVLLSGCNKDEETPAPSDCETSTFPSTSGTATVKFLNFTSDPDADGIIDVTAAAGDYLSIAVEVTKGTNRPQKLRVYETDCKNQKGTQVKFEGQSNVSSDGTVDLRNTDEAQVRTLVYQVPTGKSTLYLNFEVDESNSAYSYKRIKLNISGSGIVDSWTDKILGGNTNSNGSRMSSATGQIYLACDAAENINYIDITYAVSLSDGKSYISSNPARFLTPINLTVKTVNCGEDGTLPTDGGNATYFKANSSVNFDNATDADLGALTVSSSDKQYVQVTTVGQVFEFLTTNNRKGLIKVTGGTLNDASKTITVSVKVQR